MEFATCKRSWTSIGLRRLHATLAEAVVRLGARHKEGYNRRARNRRGLGGVKCGLLTFSNPARLSWQSLL